MGECQNCKFLCSPSELRVVPNFSAFRSKHAMEQWWKDYYRRKGEPYAMKYDKTVRHCLKHLLCLPCATTRYVSFLFFSCFLFFSSFFSTFRIESVDKRDWEGLFEPNTVSLSALSRGIRTTARFKHLRCLHYSDEDSWEELPVEVLEFALDSPGLWPDDMAVDGDDWC